MRMLVVSILILAVTALGVAQEATAKFEPGTIMAVTVHQPPPARASDSRLYDVSIRVGNKIYVVLFDPNPDSKIVEYRVGADLPVSVGATKIRFTDVRGRMREVPILKTSAVPPKG